MSRVSYFLLCVSLVAGLSSDKGSRIINGTEAYLGQFPWQARVVSSTYSCGGVILSPEWILTAAYCLQGRKDVQVYTGQVKISEGDVSAAKEVIIHPYYDSTIYVFNIGLIKLDQELRFGAYTNSIPLTEEDLLIGTEVVVSGWGRHTPDGPNASNYLSFYYGKIESNLQCGNVYNHISIFPENVCLVSTTGTDSLCHGDIGDPLVMNLHTTPVLVGFGKSFSSDCSLRSSIFVRTAPFVGWIKQNTGI